MVRLAFHQRVKSLRLKYGSKCMEGVNKGKPGPCPGPTQYPDPPQVGGGAPFVQSTPPATQEVEPQAASGASTSNHPNPAGDYKANGTKARAFKAWFGDWENDPENASKVVDEDGQPLIVYHGTAAEFDEFRADTKNAWSDSLGFDTYFFSKGKATASSYANQFEGGKVMPVYVNIKKPLMIDAKGGEWMDAIGEAVDHIRTYRTPQEKHFYDVKSAYEEKYGWELEYDPDAAPPDETRKVEAAAREFEDHLTANRKLYKAAKRHPYGYDGVIVKDVLDMTAAAPDADEETGSYNPFTTVYVAFSPNQVKSVRNEGMFDPSSPKMGKSLRLKYGVNRGRGLSCR